MKKVSIGYLTMLITLVSCSDKETRYEMPMQFYAYGRDASTLKTSKLTARFYLFDANDGQEFKEERLENPSGEESDYTALQCKQLNLLRERQELELKDGTKVKTLRMIIALANEPEFVEDIPDGKYYIVAAFPTGSGRFKGKYSGKYIEKHKDMPSRERTISIVFPDDISFKGFFEWEEMKSWNDK